MYHFRKYGIFLQHFLFFVRINVHIDVELDAAFIICENLKNKNKNPGEGSFNDYVDQILPLFAHHLPKVDKRGHLRHHLPDVHVNNSKIHPRIT